MTKTPWHHGGPPRLLSDERGTLWMVLVCARDTCDFEYLLVARTRKKKSKHITRPPSHAKTYPPLSTVLVNEKKMIFPTPTPYFSSSTSRVVLVSTPATTFGLWDLLVHVRQSDLCQSLCLAPFNVPEVMKSSRLTRAIYLHQYGTVAPSLPPKQPAYSLIHDSCSLLSLLLLPHLHVPHTQRHSSSSLLPPLPWSKRDKSSNERYTRETRLWV
jgi:hypothetical protein